MKKKILLGIVVIIVLIVIILLGIKKYKISDKYIIKKGFQLYGNEHCAGGHFFSRTGIGGYGFKEIKCDLCGARCFVPDYGKPMCNECLNITNRCSVCGKLN